MKKGILAAFIILGFILLPVNQVYAQPHWHANTHTIETPDLVVRFFNRQPQYIFWVPGENETAVYIVKFHEIIEFIDEDGDGALSPGDDILSRSMLLESDVNWKISAETLSGPNNSTEIRITMSALVPVYKTAMDGGRIGYVNVTFINHIYDRDVEVEGYIVEGNKELKIDIIIENWPWINSESKLALGIIFAGHFRGKHGVPHMEHHRVKEKVKEVKMRGEDAPYSGAFRYREEVKLCEKEGERIGSVHATEEFSMHEAILYLVYPHFEGILIHDPSITVIKPESTILEVLTNVYFLVALAGIIILGTVIVVTRKK